MSAAEVIASVRALLAKATGRPWRADVSQPDDVVMWGQRELGNPDHEDGNFLGNVCRSRVSEVGVACDFDTHNARTIALAVNALPSVLDLIETLTTDRVFCVCCERRVFGLSEPLPVVSGGVIVPHEPEPHASDCALAHVLAELAAKEGT